MAVPLHLCLVVHLAPGHMWAGVPAALASLDETFQASSPYQRKLTGWLQRGASGQQPAAGSCTAGAAFVHSAPKVSESIS